MKIVSESDCLVITEAYSGVLLRTEEGNELGICMRDDTFEFNVMPKGSTEHKWFRINMQTRTVEVH